MLGGGHPDDSVGDVARPVSRRQRLFARPTRDAERTPVGERLRNLVLKPVQPGTVSTDKAAGRQSSVEELEADVRSANDKERLIGLVAAPLAAAIGILVISALIVNDPPARLKNGQIDTLHVSLSLYYDLGAVILGLAVLMLVTAMWRKRLYLGIVTALYGLAIFNLHYWGFGIPFILLSAWLLVRAYRLQRDLRAASGDSLLRAGAQNEGSGATPPRSSRKPNSRYTPPAAAPRRSSAPRPGNRQRAR
ncbi:MAG: hypothetical protein ABSF89_05310 [Acidimicrobiales bacterium]|jgi:hypothetical protein